MPRLEFVARIEFVGRVGDEKECLMSQDERDPSALWFNIDAPKGHGFAPGDQVRVTVEKL